MGSGHGRNRGGVRKTGGDAHGNSRKDASRERRIERRKRGDFFIDYIAPPVYRFPKLVESTPEGDVTWIAKFVTQGRPFAVYCKGNDCTRINIAGACQSELEIQTGTATRYPLVFDGEPVGDVSPEDECRVTSNGKIHVNVEPQ